jgi:hypothetical protein
MQDEQATTEPVRERVVERPTTTIVERRGSGGSFLIGLAVLIAVLVGAWYFVSASQSRSARDGAIEEAASSVGRAAEKVGDAVSK